MDVKNRELLESVITNRLMRAEIADGEEDSQAFKEAMAALDKAIELEKLKYSHDEQVEKLKIENERLKVERDKNLRDEAARKEEAKRERIFKIATIIVEIFGAAAFDYFVKVKFAKLICTFERDYTFTTHAGKSISDYFRFKRRH